MCKKKNYMHQFVYKFCNRKYLKEKHVIEVRSNENRDYVYLEDPILLARLVGFVKNKLGKPQTGCLIYLRGQTSDHPGMVPSLFRNLDIPEDDFYIRLKAYEELIRGLLKIKNIKRFKGEVGGALLQHYGINTPWLDLVDNLFIALWFACHQRTKTVPYSYLPSNQDKYGWLYLLRFENSPIQKGISEGRNTRWCNLQTNQTSLSLRAHVQHGIFGTIQNNNSQNFDLNELIVASIKFPITKEFLNIVSIPPTFLFPSTYHDNTYKYLKQESFKKLMQDLNNKRKYKNVDLGEILDYA